MFFKRAYDHQTLPQSLTSCFPSSNSNIVHSVDHRRTFCNHENVGTMRRRQLKFMESASNWYKVWRVVKFANKTFVREKRLLDKAADQSL